MNNTTTPDPQAELLKAVADANRPPNPPEWVQEIQMLLAGLLFLFAFAFAFLLVLKGPPAPKAAEGSDDKSTPAAITGPSGPTTGMSGPTTSAFQLTAEGEPPAPGTTGEGGVSPGDSPEPGTPGTTEPGKEGEPTEPEGSGTTEKSEEGEGEDSLASLNEQAPWAFAIVALLVGAFLATGKTLSFSGVSSGRGTGDGQ